MTGGGDTPIGYMCDKCLRGTGNVINFLSKLGIGAGIFIFLMGFLAISSNSPFGGFGIILIIFGGSLILGSLIWYLISKI